jgi:glycosyltransferase involved in cell wall biosynthesis
LQFIVIFTAFAKTGFIFKSLMKILQIHNAYQQKGGEDAVVQSEREFLESKNQVLTYTINNDSIHGLYAKITTALNSHYSQTQKTALYHYLIQHKFDIVHVHNFFPLLTPSIYDACIKANIPVVQTLHNYRTICSNALSMKKGEICEKCINSSPYHAVLYGCYRNSRIGSVFVARMVNYHRKSNTWNTKVNRFIALTEFAKNKFIEAGFPDHKIAVKPNFIADSFKKDSLSESKEPFALFVGRFSQEKGVSVLLDAWKNIDYTLKLAGDGPVFDACKINAHQNAVFLGNQSKLQIHELMSQAQFLVMPSICSRLGSMAEIVENGVTGLHFEAGNVDDLALKVNWLITHPDKCQQMGSNARTEYLEKYTPEKNYQILMDIYQDAISESQ